MEPSGYGRQIGASQGVLPFGPTTPLPGASTTPASFRMERIALDSCRSETIPGRTGSSEAPMSRSLLILAVLTALARTVSAATIAVDRFDDSTAIAATACSAAPGDCSLRGAILKANGGAGGDTIMPPAGTDNLTITNDVAPEDAAMTGDLDITKSVT